MKKRPDNATILATIKAHGPTKSYAEISALLGLPPGVVMTVGRRAGFRKPWIYPQYRKKQVQQRAVILAHAATHTLHETGLMLGLTHERVRQLCKKWKIERSKIHRRALGGVSDERLRALARQPDKTIAVIAREAGMSPGRLSAEWRRRGIQLFTKRERNVRLLKKGLRVCALCKRTKPLDQFAHHHEKPGGYGYRCLECTMAYTREWMKRQAGRQR